MRNFGSIHTRRVCAWLFLFVVAVSQVGSAQRRLLDRRTWREYGGSPDNAKYMTLDQITKANVRDLVGKGLEQARGNYKIVARLFNMDVCDYKKFLNFLRKHECQVPFREYR